MTVVLGIDIGGSGIKGAPVDITTGQLVGERLRIPTPDGARPDDVIRVLRQLADHFGLDGPVGVTFPGIVQHGRTLSAANVDAAWIGLDADTEFTRALGREVHLLNDADAAGLAEAKFGAGQGVSGTVLVLTFGTGIGSALIHDGVLVPNTELGHLWLREHHAETWASDRARERDDLNWKQWAKRASGYLRHLELLFSPDLFIIGGGVSKKADKWSEHLKLDRSRFVPAALLNDAGIIGAAMSAAQHEDLGLAAQPTPAAQPSLTLARDPGSAPVRRADKTGKKAQAGGPPLPAGGKARRKKP